MNHLWNLQLFAEGGASAAAAAPADGDGGNAGTAAQPSEARLRELGVPEERLQKRAKRKKGDVKQESPVAASPEAGQAVDTKSGEQYPLSLRDIPPLHKGGEEKSAPTIGGRSYDIRAHYDGMHRQAAELAAKYPDFDLQKELDNPTFLRLTGPEIGLPLEDAYMAMHHRELTRAIAEQSRRELSNSIRAGSARPAEHGMEAKAPSMVTFDYKNASRSQRAAFKKQIYDAAARGEKIYPVR